MTLIEMLVATTVTLVLMAAIGQVFSRFGSSVSGSRSALDLNARMRTAAWRLRQDLSGATAPAIPPLDPADGMGYFEIIEGPRHDADAADGTPVLEADTDDVLLFTTKSAGASFLGVFAGRTIESDIAEVAWFARPTVPATTPATYTVYRKQMLVAGYVGAGPFNASGAQNRIPFASLAAPQWRTLYDTYDLSISRRRVVPVGGPPVDVFVPNTLADLTKREYRFMHNVAGDTSGLPAPAGQFPYGFVNHLTPLASGTLPPGFEGLIFDATSPRFGEDVILTNVIAFDIRVFDPAAPIASSPSGNDVVTPLDQNSPPGPVFPPGPILANGAYVDLGNGITIAGPSGVPPRFSGFGSPLSRFAGSASLPCVYDTWSTHYEADGIDQDGVAGADQGANGTDDQVPARLTTAPVAADGVIDDVDEWETRPPYPYPLRGIEVRIRCYEPSSRRIRQVTVRHSFVQ